MIGDFGDSLLNARNLPSEKGQCKLSPNAFSRGRVYRRFSGGRRSGKSRPGPWGRPGSHGPIGPIPAHRRFRRCAGECLWRLVGGCSLSRQIRVTAIVVLLAWHLAALNSLSLYAGHGGLFSAPRRLFTCKDHLIGIGCWLLGVSAILGSKAMGLLDFGIFVGITLFVADSIFIYRAVRRIR